MVDVATQQQRPSAVGSDLASGLAVTIDGMVDKGTARAPVGELIGDVVEQGALDVVDALLDRLLSGEAAAAAGGATEGIGHNEPPVTLAERTCGTQRTMGRRRARSE